METSKSERQLYRFLSVILYRLHSARVQLRIFKVIFILFKNLFKNISTQLFFDYKYFTAPYDNTGNWTNGSGFDENIKF